MIIFLITFAILIIAIILTIVFHICNAKTHYDFSNALVAGVIITIAVAFLATFPLTFAVINSIEESRGVAYANALYEREVLEYRLSSEGLTGNELLYRDVLEFNNYLRDIKQGASNPWLNWFYNKDVAIIDYIEIFEEAEK